MDLAILIVTCVINIVLGLFVFLRDIRKTHTRLFVLTCMLLTVWIVSNYFTNHYTEDISVTDIANKLAYVSGYGVVLTALLFTYVFPYHRKVSGQEKLLITILSTLIIGLSMTEAVAGTVGIDAKGTLIYGVGSWLSLYIVGYIILLVLIGRNLLKIPISEGRLKKRQAVFILIAFNTTAVLGLIFNAIIPLVWSDWNSTRFGPLVTIIMVGTIAYTIIKHGLFDMRLAVVRAVTYSLVLTTLAAVYYITAYAISQTILTTDSAAIGATPLNVALALLLAFMFQPVKIFFDKLTNKVFYRDNYSFDDFFARLSRELSTTTDLRNLLLRAADEINATLKSEYTFFFMRYGDNKHITVGTRRHSSMTLADIQMLDELLVDKNTVIVTDVLDENDPLYQLFSQHNIAMTLPLEHADGIIGYLFLGYQRGRDYTKRDIRALEAISDELVIAVQNALSVQEVKEINATLQQRIEEATKELRETNAQLQRLDEAKDEFVSMASHQLRTPLTSVKGYISMVLEGDVGKISTSQRQLLEEAFTSSERMVHLINDFLNVSRLQTGKFIVETHRIDLARVVTQEVESLQTTAHAHNLKLQFHQPSYFPMLYLDEGKIRQVLMNFIDNAIYYSREHTTITVELTVEEGDAVVKVHDTGIGVPKAEQSHLFTKFFRATNARKQRPDGTGVGLFLAKKVIVAHGGSMLFESEEDEGSTFGFRLPIKKLSTASAEETDELEK